MNKEDNDRIKEIEIELAVDRFKRGWIRTVCITATSTAGAVLLWLGTIVYDKFPAFKAAIITFVQVDKGIK